MTQRKSTTDTSHAREQLQGCIQARQEGYAASAGAPMLVAPQPRAMSLALPELAQQLATFQVVLPGSRGKL